MTTKITEKNISNLANLGVDWQSVITADGSTNTNAVAGKGYLIDTTSAVSTIVLPSSPKIGDTLSIRDYAGTFGTNNVTIDRNGSNIAGTALNGVLFTNNIMTTLVYVDTTKGWVSLENEAKSSAILPGYVAATGGTIATSGNFKIHSFTGDGCFVVSCGGNVAGSSSVSYIVVAGGGGGGFGNAGNGGGSGAGAGGYREGKSDSDSYTASPLVAPTGVTVSASTYPVTVGGGGVGGSPGTGGAVGSNSVFSIITSAGGGGGGGDITSGIPATVGGSGAAQNTSIPSCNRAPCQGALGNSPPVSPPQGNPGGASSAGKRGGGGGAGQAGQPQALTAFSPAPSGTSVPAPAPQTGGGTYGWGAKGGDGVSSSITGSPVTRAGGGGGGGYEATSGGDARFGGGGVGGAGGGGNASYAPPGFPGPSVAGSTNTGGGGGGGATSPPNGSAGGSGIVIIRYKFQ